MALTHDKRAATAIAHRRRVSDRVGHEFFDGRRGVELPTSPLKKPLPVRHVVATPTHPQHRDNHLPFEHSQDCANVIVVERMLLLLENIIIIRTPAPVATEDDNPSGR